MVLYKDGRFYKQLAAVSGRAHTQNRNRDRGGTEAPLPDGKYRISSHTVPGTHPEVGGAFLPVTPQFRTERNALGIHYDPSFEATNGEDGTAGSIALTNPQARDTVMQFVREYQPQTLIVAIMRAPQPNVRANYASDRSSPARSQNRVCTRDPNGRLNMRQAPSTGTRILVQIPNGTPVSTSNMVTGGDGYPWYIVSYAGYNGWVRGDFIC